MMILKPVKNIQGSIEAPSSKSAFIRHIAASVLSSDDNKLFFKNKSNDITSAINIARKLGKYITEAKGELTIENPFSLNTNKISCGESGLAIRMFAPIIALTGKDFILEAEGSLLKRSTKNIFDSLNKFGVNYFSNNNFPPVRFSGSLKNSDANLNFADSSQLFTGLLFALPLTKGNSILTVENLKSKPYIDLTLDILSKYGVNVENENYEKFYIPGNQKYKGLEIAVEGDWSGAAFLAVAGAVGGKIEIKNLNGNSFQADRAIVDVLKEVGANIYFENNSLFVENKELDSFEFNAEDCPDLFPPLVSLAAFCSGESKIYGVSRLYNKESNRALTLQKEFGKLGIKISFENNFMKIEGGKITPAKVFSHNDHRIAMATALSSIFSDGNITVEKPDAVNKSYPSFFEDFKNISNYKE